MNFLSDMGLRPSSKHCIERQNNHGDYSPSNCAWKLKTDQMNNTRSNNRITIGGKTKTLPQWCEYFGQKYHLAEQRIRELKWEPKRALTTPPGKYKKKG